MTEPQKTAGVSAKDVIKKLQKDIRTLNQNQQVLREENEQLVAGYQALQNAVFLLLSNQFEIAIAAGNSEYAANFAGTMYTTAPAQTADLLVTAMEFLPQEGQDQLRESFEAAGVDFDELVAERRRQRNEA